MDQWEDNWKEWQATAEDAEAVAKELEEKRLEGCEVATKIIAMRKQLKELTKMKKILKGEHEQVKSDCDALKSQCEKETQKLISLKTRIVEFERQKSLDKVTLQLESIQNKMEQAQKQAHLQKHGKGSSWLQT